MTEFRKYYAQNREDIILEGFFADQDKGFYVDIGANHPTVDSVTKLFYEKGWRGINVEPNANLYQLLNLERPRDTNLQVGISDKPGELSIRVYPEGHGFSTFSKKMQASYEHGPSVITDTYEDYIVPVITLKQLFAEQKVGTIDYLKVDVEGFEYEVLVSNDWKKYRPKVICIESNHIEQDWRPLLKEASYNLIFFDGLNNYYVAAEHKKIADRFSYVETVLLNKTPVYAEFYDRVAGTNSQSVYERQKLAKQEIIIENLGSEIIQLKHQIKDQLRLRSLVKNLIRTVDAICLLQIERLNRPNVYKSKVVLETSKLSPQEQIAVLQAYDLQRYFGSGVKPPLLYRMLHGTYFTLSRAVFKLARSAIRAIRKVRSHGTK